MGRRKKGSNKRGGSTLEDAVSDDETAAPGEDGLYDEVDAWENEQDRELASKVKKAGRKGKQENMEMFALSGTDSDSDLELPKLKKKKKKSEAEQEIEMKDEDFLGSDVDEDNEDNVRAWGSRKKHFYGGNTGEGVVTSDSEYDEDEAEEKEAEILQERQMGRMQEEDFLDTFILQENKDTKDEVEKIFEETVKRDLSALSQKERSALFRHQAPEFDGIVLDFREKMAEAIQLSKIVSLEDSGQLPVGPATEFVRVKFQLLTNYCTNIAAYLMFKAKGTNLKLHPVTGRLVEYKLLIDSLEAMDRIVKPQIESLVERLESGEKLDNIIKEEKRRARKKEMKNGAKTKKLKLLQKKKVPEEEKDLPVEKTKKRKLDKREDLTGDEKMAVELYKAIKRNKIDLQEESEDEDEEEDDDEAAAGEARVLNNDEVEPEDGEEPGKRGITYQIAKNKGLMPKRSKLQRNPRVKNRMKYEKAKKRRKGAVREVRTETTRYGGEMSGINARVKKGVKFR